VLRRHVRREAAAHGFGPNDPSSRARLHLRGAAADHYPQRDGGEADVKKYVNRFVGFLGWLAVLLMAASAGWKPGK
jgi:hypothetical protein